MRQGSNHYPVFMSVEEIKNQLVALSPDERNQVSAYLLHLRDSADPDYQAEISARLNDKDPSHWLTLEEFERRLDQK